MYEDTLYARRDDPFFSITPDEARGLYRMLRNEEYSLDGALQGVLRRLEGALCQIHSIAEMEELAGGLDDRR